MNDSCFPKDIWCNVLLTSLNRKERGISVNECGLTGIFGFEKTGRGIHGEDRGSFARNVAVAQRQDIFYLHFLF